MKMSDMIADMILDMFDDSSSSSVQIQRNDLANRVGCVPSQINYVITSRFTPEAGYRIESHRGGGGYILITRAESKDNALLALINSIGNSIDERTAKAHISNLNYQNIIDDKSASIMASAIKDSNFTEIEKEAADKVRARQLKQVLIAYIN